MTKQEILNQLQLFVGTGVEHKTFGSGTIQKFEESSGILAEIAFADRLRLIAISAVRTIMTMSDEINNLLNEYDIEVEEEERKQLETEKLAYEQLQIERDKKLEEEKYNMYVATIKDKAQSLLHSTFTIDATEEELLKAGVKSVYAQVPDFLVSWFKSIFPNIKYREVDSKRKTSGGYKMKWGLSMEMTFNKDAVIPARLVSKVKGNKITDTAVVFDVCNAYGLH